MEMRTLKQHIDIFTILTVNTGALVFASVPTLSIIESVMKIAVLFATLIFTVIKIFKIIKGDKKINE